MENQFELFKPESFYSWLNRQPGDKQKRGRAAIIRTEHEEATPQVSTHVADSGLDMGASLVNELKEVIDIPEYVFALQCVHPDLHILGEAQVPLGQDPTRHFILNYRQPLPFAIRKNNTSTQKPLNCTAHRTIVQRIRSLQGLEIEDADTVEQLVSYWQTSKDGCHIAVLLVDPCPSKQMQFGDDDVADPKATRPHPYLSELAYPEEDPGKSSADGNEPSPAVREGKDVLSLFDEIVHEEEVRLHLWNPSPIEWTFQCRRLVLAKTASVIQSAFVETWKLTGNAATGAKKMASLNFAKLKEEAWSNNWKGEFFTQLWELREDLELMRYRLELNHTDIMKLATIETEMMQGRLRDLEDIEAEHISTRKRHFQLSKIKARIRQIDCDMREWTKLIQVIDYAFKLMTRTTETYVQTVGATGTQFANEQAQNSRKLTGFAAIFIPASLCAAILAIPSMTPDSKSPLRFWLFWAISVPIAIMLALWFLTPMPNWIKKQWKARAEAETPENIQKRVDQADPDLPKEEKSRMKQRVPPTRRRFTSPKRRRSTGIV